ncbi:unnamed protein product [Meloidogyne enterolobii]|uniref:Uncharacterized protein n=1 Tax=Meloidogyne enterolobii TaxID=390850 RepID=A0ACB0Y9M0_MELEN
MIIMSSSTSTSTSSYSPSINAPPNSSPPSPSSPPNSPPSSPTISNSEIKNTKKLFSKKFVGQENCFETIARLAGIDDQEEVEEEEEINKKEIKEELKEITEINDLINNEDVDNEDKKDKKLNEMNYTNNKNKKEIPINSQSCNNLFSSSSRRKNGNPTRMIDEIILKNLRRKRNLEEEKEEEDEEKEENKDEEEEEDEDNNKSGNERDIPVADSNENKIQGEILGQNNNSSNECPPPLPFEGLFSPSYATDINRTEEMPFGEEGVEQQQRKQFYTQLIQQYGNNNQIFDIQRKMANYLKEDLNGIICSGAIDKVLTDISSQELHNNNTQTSRFLAALQQNVRQQQFGLFGNNIRTLTTSIPSFIPHSSMPLSTSSRIFSSSMPSSSSSISLINSNISPSSTVNPFQAFLAITQNPLIATAMAAAAAAASFAQQQQQSQISAQNSNNNNQNGIFPSSLTVTETNKKLNFSQPRPTINLQRFQQNNDGSPRKKRQKVTDSVRGPRSNLHCREPSNNYNSTCERLTPNGGFVMPTMVPQQRVFCSPDRNLGDSPSGDDSGGDNNNYIANNDLNKILQLNHVHLRKAKLMFFYQRYPSSSVLKSYFPDVQFNKHNTAQVIFLVKWFSNFRYFYIFLSKKFC